MQMRHSHSMHTQLCWYTCFITTVKNNPVAGESQDSSLTATIRASTSGIPWIQRHETPVFLRTIAFAPAHAGYSVPGDVLFSSNPS